MNRVNDERKEASQILARMKTDRVTVADLKAVLKDYGYDVIEYGTSAGADRLIEELNLKAFTAGGAFTYSSGSIRLVFVDGRLNETEKRKVLAHELGHVACGHLMNPGESNYNIGHEYQANEFTHYLLNPSLMTRTRVWMRRRWICVALVMALLMAGFAVWSFADIGYYVTRTGSKYHKRNCEYIRSRRGVKRIFDVTGYEPCEVCIR
ncbi:MAG: ImmA/IrrE family metallo-endopeptidase [Clostridia bacterium]|nr:ImmA/IrrE family metallo-endopeptidase [Clostridia bacterium]